MIAELLIAATLSNPSNLQPAVDFSVIQAPQAPEKKEPPVTEAPSEPQKLRPISDSPIISNSPIINQINSLRSSPVTEDPSLTASAQRVANGPYGHSGYPA